MKLKKKKIITVVCTGGRDLRTGEVITSTFSGRITHVIEDTVYMNLIGEYNVSRTKPE